MNKKIIAAVLAALVVLAGGWYVWQASRPLDVPAPPPPPQAVAAPQPVLPPPKAEPAPRYPLALPPPGALPEMERSDAPMQQALGDLLGPRVLALIFGDALIQRIVMTVDNLPRARLPPDAMLLKPVPGAFVTAGQGDTLVIGRRNAARYTPYVRIVRGIDAARLVAIYGDFYPLFQQAYVALINRNAYFNDRLVEAIDDMLAAPEPAGPIRLVRSDGHYEFADAELARRSAGQKILLRMGGANAALVKAKLRDIRQLVASGAAPAAPPG